MFRRVVSAAAILVIAGVLLVLAWPALFGLQRQTLIAQVVALRGLGVLVGLALVVLVGVFALMWRRPRRFLGGVTVLLLAFSAVGLAVLGSRGFDPGPSPEPAEGDVTVMVWNTLGDAPGAERIARVAIDAGADIVVLPETSAATAEIVAAAMGQAGRPMSPLHLSFDEFLKARTTSLLVSTELGEYTRDEAAGTTPVLPSFVAVPVDGDGPTIVAAHPVAPVPSEMSGWREGLDWLAAQCTDAAEGADGAGVTGGAGVIMAGDLNATLDHFQGLGTAGGDLGACRDGARAAGAGALGTWPVAMPELLGAPIDHVLATADWETVDFRVLGAEDGSGSDHRPVVATLRRVP